MAISGTSASNQGHKSKGAVIVEQQSANTNGASPKIPSIKKLNTQVPKKIPTTPLIPRRNSGAVITQYQAPQKNLAGLLKNGEARVPTPKPTKAELHCME